MLAWYWKMHGYMKSLLQVLIKIRSLAPFLSPFPLSFYTSESTCRAETLCCYIICLPAQWVYADHTDNPYLFTFLHSNIILSAYLKIGFWRHKKSCLNVTTHLFLPPPLQIQFQITKAIITWRSLVSGKKKNQFNYTICVLCFNCC